MYFARGFGTEHAVSGLGSTSCFLPILLDILPFLRFVSFQDQKSNKTVSFLVSFPTFSVCAAESAAAEPCSIGTFAGASLEEARATDGRPAGIRLG